MDELDPLAKNWRDHVREMSYDMENCIDDFMRDLGGADVKAGFIKKTAKRLKTLRKRHRIADRMEELKVLALQANEGRMRYIIIIIFKKEDPRMQYLSHETGKQRYKIDDCINSTSRVIHVDPRMSAIYKDASLVGIDGPKKELVSWLTDTQEKLKVVAIVGFGGLGKTTLAKQVYDEIGGQFTSKAFVSISQRPDMISLLGGLQLKLGMKEESSQIREVQDTIDFLREHLTHKRYLNVVDDLWDQSTWNIMSCLFPDVDNGSRVIVTTRVDNVAIGACSNDRECVYRMKTLKELDSRILFFNRVFGSEDDCPPQFKEISAGILRRCGGLPLAIITCNHHLQSKDEWESIRNSLSAKFATNPTLEEMRSILDHSYMHLPHHLRPCLLYLGMYPEDKIISKDDLVVQWVAEGFVNSSHGSDLEDVAKSYLNELINRSLIQSAGISSFAGVEYCTVHDLMLDLNISKCAEDNFISVAYNCEDVARMHSYEYKVRRLSIKSSASDTTSVIVDTSMSQVRSFAQFVESNYTPPLSLFTYLRVLMYDFPYKGTTVDLTPIDQLFQLRYVRVNAHGCIVDLPTEIRGLVHLETLTINGRSTQNFPSDIVLLPRLSYLNLPDGTGLPQGIASVKSLRVLWCPDMEKSSLEDIKGIGEELTGLRELGFSGKAVAREAVDALVSSIGKLCDLRLLCVLGEPSKHYCDQMYSLSNPPLHIEVLSLLGWPLKRVPNWIGELHCLYNLTLLVEHLSTDEVHVVGKLPSLIDMFLCVLSITEHSGAAIVRTGLFSVLEDLMLFSHDATVCMEFEAGAMPKLRQLHLQIRDGWGGAMPLGMEHLLSLEHVEVDVRSSIHKDSDVESAFKSAAKVHPGRPSVTVF